MLGLVLAVLCVTAQVAFAQQQFAPIPAGITEEQLYANLGPVTQFAQGYGDESGQKMERIDNPLVELPPMEETQQGKDEVIDHMFPKEQKENRIAKTKEIHSFSVQKKTINVNNRILHRYLKELLVNTVYNTNLQKINHEKIINLLLTTLQETHQPKLLVKYSRQDMLNNLGDRSEAPVIENEQQNKVLPPVFLPATAEKIGYNGQSLGADVMAAGAMNAAALSKLSQRTSLPVGLSYNNGPGYISSGSSSSSGYNVQSTDGGFSGNNYLKSGNSAVSGSYQQQQNGQNYQDQQQHQPIGDNGSGQQTQYNSDVQTFGTGGSANSDNTKNGGLFAQQQSGGDISAVNNGNTDSSQQQQANDAVDASASAQQQQQQQVGADNNGGVQQKPQYSSGITSDQSKYQRASRNLKESAAIRK